MTNNMACKPACGLSPNGKWVNIYRAAGNHTYQATSADGLTWTNYTLLDTGLAGVFRLAANRNERVEGVYSSDTTNAAGQLVAVKFNPPKVKYIRLSHEQSTIRNVLLVLLVGGNWLCGLDHRSAFLAGERSIAKLIAAPFNAAGALGCSRKNVGGSGPQPRRKTSTY